HLGDAIGVAITPAHHSPDIAHHTYRSELAKGDDLRHPTLTILLPNVFEDFAATRFAKIDVDIRRGNAIRIQKPLENQPVLQRIDVSNSQNVSNHRARSRTATRANRNAPLLGEMDEIPNDEQITDETGFLQHPKFVIEPFKQFRVSCCTLAVAFAQALITKLAQITFARFSSWNRIFRIFRTSKL